jgi:2-dehydro-3-deoxyphosphogluconate aldolase/(4S)-4-hydroxy-2-oxoglutarate aldolase
MTADTEGLVTELARRGVVAVARERDTRRAMEMAEALAAAGINAIEVTFTVPDAPTVIAALAERRDLFIAAGTVLEERQAAAAIEAGARCLVSPVRPPFLLEVAREAGVLAMPGAATPQEIWESARAGAPVVKVFPAGPLGGPAYLRQIRAPLPELRLMPSGGVCVETVGAYRKVGAVAVSLGGALTREPAELGPRCREAWQATT